MNDLFISQFIFFYIFLLTSLLKMFKNCDIKYKCEYLILIKFILIVFFIFLLIASFFKIFIYAKI